MRSKLGNEMLKSFLLEEGNYVDHQVGFGYSISSSKCQLTCSSRSCWNHNKRHLWCSHRAEIRYLFQYDAAIRVKEVDLTSSIHFHNLVTLVLTTLFVRLCRNRVSDIFEKSEERRTRSLC